MFIILKHSLWRVKICGISPLQVELREIRVNHFGEICALRCTCTRIERETKGIEMPLRLWLMNTSFLLYGFSIKFVCCHIYRCLMSVVSQRKIYIQSVYHIAYVHDIYHLECCILHNITTFQSTSHPSWY